MTTRKGRNGVVRLRSRRRAVRGGVAMLAAALIAPTSAAAEPAARQGQAAVQRQDPQQGARQQDPQQAEQQARDAFQAGRFREAYLALRPALEAAPERPDLWFLLGQIVEGMGQPERALQAYDASITLKSDVPAAWFARGLVLLELEQFEDAVASLERCKQLAPGQERIALYLGMARLRAGNAYGAVEALASADPAASDYGEVVRFRTEALRTLGRNNDAVNAATTYLDSVPDYPPVRFELALALIAAGRGPEGLVAMREAAVASPPYPPAVLEYGRALRDSDAEQDHIEAAALYRNSLDYFPGDGAMRGELATLYVELGLESDAAGEAARIVEVSPGDAEALLIAGNVLLQVKRPDEALVALQKAVPLEPENPMIHHHLGLALVQLQRIDEALAAFDHALERDPQLLETRVQAAHAALLVGLPERALGFFETAGPEAEESAEAQAVLGEAYVEAQRFEEALPPLKRALELDPDLADAPYLLARAYRGTGQTDLANQALAEFQARADERAATQVADAEGDVYRQHLMRTRAAVYVAEGRFDEAVPVLESAIAERSDDPDLYDLMAAAYDGLGDEQKAADMRRRAAELRHSFAEPGFPNAARQHREKTPSSP